MQRGPKHITPGNGSWWEPSTEADEKALAGLDEVIYDLKKNRSPGNHRRYFAFIRLAFDMQEHFGNDTIFRKHLQIAAGHVDIVIDPKTGETMLIPKSISWDELGEDEFKPLFNDVINAFINVYGERLDPSQIDQIVRF